MSMAYIRALYDVPAKRGGRVRLRWVEWHSVREGVIVGSRGAHLRIRLDGDKKAGTYHPAWGIEYL